MLNEKIKFEENLPINIKVVQIREWLTHYHDDIEIVYVLNGQIKLKNVHYTYTLNEGSVFILNDREMHSLYSDTDTNMVLIVHLKLEYFAQYFDELYNSFFITDVFNNDDQSIDVIRKNLISFLSEYIIKDNDFEKRIIQYANNLLSCLISDFRYFTFEEGMFINQSKNRGNKILAERLRRVTYYIYENHSEKITLADVAKNVHLSDYYLSHLIKTFTGLSFQEYLNFARVEESEKLLLGTDKSISQIALECGFSAIRYYTRCFESWYGISPTEYRQQYIEKKIINKNLPKYETFDNEIIIEYLKSNHKDIFLGIRQIRKINIKAVNIDVNEYKEMSPGYIKACMAFYCDVRDIDSNPIEIYKVCKELEISSLDVRITNMNFQFNGIDKMIEVGIKLKFEVVKDRDEKYNNIIEMLKIRYKDLYVINLIDEDESKEAINYIYDSAVMIPYLIREITLKINLIKTRIIDSQKTASLTSGGFGILNSMFMRKPSYYAYKMINDVAKGRIIDAGEGYLVSKEDNTVRVLVYSEAQKLRIFKNPEELISTMTGEIDEEEIIIKLNNMLGNFRVQSYYYENQNSILNVHANLGYRTALTKEEEHFIEWVTVPSTDFFNVQALGILSLSTKLTQNSARIYIINKE